MVLQCRCDCACILVCMFVHACGCLCVYVCMFACVSVVYVLSNGISEREKI